MARRKVKKSRRSLRGFLGGIEKEIDECVGSKPECIVDVIEAAAASAERTAAHLTEHWQDRKAAFQWRKISAKLEKTARQVKGDLPF